MQKLAVRKLSVRVNGYAKIALAQGVSISMLKGCLTLAHRELDVGEDAELYKSDRCRVLLEKRSPTACAGRVLQDDNQVAHFECSGTRYSGSDATGLSLLGLHFARRVCLAPSPEVVEALLDCARPGAALIPRPGPPGSPGPPTLDFCLQPTRNAFASLYHFNKKVFGQVAAACARSEEQVHTELALVAMLSAGLAAGACGERQVHGEWCSLSMQLRPATRVLDVATTKASNVSLKFSVQTPQGVLRVEGCDAGDAFCWRTPLPGLLLTMPKQAADRGLQESHSTTFANDVQGTVHALRAAAGGRLPTQQVAYVSARQCLHAMSPWEAALSLLCNAHGAMD